MVNAPLPILISIPIYEFYAFDQDFKVTQCHDRPDPSSRRPERPGIRVLFRG